MTNSTHKQNILLGITAKKGWGYQLRPVWQKGRQKIMKTSFTLIHKNKIQSQERKGKEDLM